MLLDNFSRFFIFFSIFEFKLYLLKFVLIFLDVFVDFVQPFFNYFIEKLLEAQFNSLIIANWYWTILLLKLLKSYHILLSLLQFMLENFYFLSLTFQSFFCLVGILPVIRSNLARCHIRMVVGWILHWDLIGIQSTELAYLKLLLGLYWENSILRSSRIRKLIWSR
jgi:hypothetical protein